LLVRASHPLLLSHPAAVQVLSSIPTVMTTWLGLHFGLVLSHYSDTKYRLTHWAAFSSVLVTLGSFISLFCEYYNYTLQLIKLDIRSSQKDAASRQSERSADLAGCLVRS
jgi:hypothetical protein